jgi:LmbE family N-acetylglucosaminyl deacetylase
MNILVIAPHPDDESLGCGGTILKHKYTGDEIYWLIMTNISKEMGYDEQRVKKRQEEIDLIAREYGFQKIYKLDYPAIRLDTIPLSEMIEQITNVIREIKPEVLYIPNRNDVHSDHKITFDVLISSTKSFRNSSIKKILMYETISETEFAPPLCCNAFIPNSFSDISEYIERKISIIKIYDDQLGEHPFPRSIENIKALATFRGATSGVKYAEAFMILKEIW